MDDDSIVVAERGPRLGRAREVDGPTDPLLLDPEGGDFQEASGVNADHLPLMGYTPLPSIRTGRGH